MALKSEGHHWWPKSLSRYWANEDGVVHQLFWDGRVVPQTNPKNFGVITNAHHIKLGDAPTVWDQSFEKHFGSADSAFPGIVEWLGSLQSEDVNEGASLSKRFRPHHAEWDTLNQLLECLLSLVVRGPKFRNSIQETTKYYRERMGFPDPSASRVLINLNLRDALQRFLDDAVNRGKFAVLISKEREFVFGDGFYHTYSCPADAPMRPCILVPITPNICILYVRPISYRTEPRLVTLHLRIDEAGFINETVLVHSCDFVFYRSQPPPIIELFARREFLQYEWNEHPSIKALIDAFA